MKNPLPSIQKISDARILASLPPFRVTTPHPLNKKEVTATIYTAYNHSTTPMEPELKSPTVTLSHDANLLTSSLAASFSSIHRMPMFQRAQRQIPISTSKIREYDRDTITNCSKMSGDWHHRRSLKAVRILEGDGPPAEFPEEASQIPQLQDRHGRQLSARPPSNNSNEASQAKAVLDLNWMEPGEANIEPPEPIIREPEDVHDEGLCYRDGEDICRAHLATSEYMYGFDDPRTLDALVGLALILKLQGRYRSAELFFRRLAEARQNTLGNDHLQTLEAFLDLADVFKKQGRYLTSERFERHVLTAHTKTLGTDHEVTMTTKLALARTLCHQERFAEAAGLDRDVLAIYSRIHGFDDLRTLRAMSDLAEALEAQGLFQLMTPTSAQGLCRLPNRTSEMYREILKMRVKLQGEDNLNTVKTKLRLGIALCEEESHEAGELLIGAALLQLNTLLGHQHPETLQAEAHLSWSLDIQGRHEEAVLIMKRVWNLKKKILGSDHPETLLSQLALGIFLRDQYRFEEAETLFREALHIRSRVLGNGHRKTLEILQFFGHSKVLQGQHQEAAKLLMGVLPNWVKNMQEATIMNSHIVDCPNIALL